jgi:hypothetical protein
MRKVAILLGLLSLPFLAPRPARADMPGDVPDKVRFEIGGMGASAFTDAAVGSKTAGLGATVNFEDIFNLPESKSVARFDLSWRIAKRQYLDFGYVKIDRSGSRVIDEDVEWKDFTFHAGAKVTAGFNTDFPYAAWRYDFLQLEQVRISGSAGIDYLGLEASLAANGGVDDPNGVPITGAVDEKVSISFPVPQLGLQLDWALSKRLALKFYNRLLYINFAGLDGTIGQTAIRFYWYFSKHAGINIGIDKDSIDIKKYTSGDTTARFRYLVQGPSLYFNFAF